MLKIADAVECAEIKRPVACRHPAAFYPLYWDLCPRGEDWLHEIKHDGYRLLVRKDGDAVSIITRGGYDWTERYPLIVAGALRLRGSFVIDGEGVVCGEDGVADFELLHSRKHDRSCFLYAFDMMERSGDDLRSLPLEERKARLRSLLLRSKMGIVYSDHVAGDDGAKIFAAACEIGLEGIVSKRRDRPYVSGPCKHWIKVKNPDAPWKKRLAEI